MEPQLFSRETPKKIAESVAKEDPYVINGLVTSWNVREWTTVAGKDAAQPIVT